MRTSSENCISCQWGCGLAVKIISYQANSHGSISPQGTNKQMGASASPWSLNRKGMVPPYCSSLAKQKCLCLWLTPFTRTGKPLVVPNSFVSVLMLLNDIKIKNKTISLGSSQIELGHQVFYRRNP